MRTFDTACFTLNNVRQFKTGHDSWTTRHVYHAMHWRSTMVLFSAKTYTPLAALVFVPTKTPNTRAILTKRPSPPSEPDTPYFQGLFDTPKQPFGLEICNLLPEGNMSFNIVHAGETNTNRGVNEVNCLRPTQSFLVDVDQCVDRTMILEGLETKTSAGDVVPMSIDQAEAQPAKKQGVYFSLAVAPQSTCATMMDKFKEGTVWKCATHIITTTVGPTVKSSLITKGPQPLGLRSMGLSRGVSGRGMPGNSLGVGGGFGAGGTFQPSSANLGSAACAFGSPASANDWGVASSPALEDLTEKSADLTKTSETIYFGDSPLAPTRVLIGAGDREPDMCPWPNSFGAPGGLPSVGNAAFSLSMGADLSAVAAAAPEFDSSKAQAGKLAYGDTRILETVVSHDMFAVEHTSPTTILCLGIYPALTFSPVPDMRALAIAEMDELDKDEGKALIARLSAVYESETCVIDLESPADVVIAQCGHKCLNHANLEQFKSQTCPLCRAPVIALVGEDGLMY